MTLSNKFHSPVNKFEIQLTDQLALEKTEARKLSLLEEVCLWKKEHWAEDWWLSAQFPEGANFGVLWVVKNPYFAPENWGTASKITINLKEFLKMEISRHSSHWSKREWIPEYIKSGKNLEYNPAFKEDLPPEINIEGDKVSFKWPEGNSAAPYEKRHSALFEGNAFWGTRIAGIKAESQLQKIDAVGKLLQNKQEKVELSEDEWFFLHLVRRKLWLEKVWCGLDRVTM